MDELVLMAGLSRVMDSYDLVISILIFSIFAFFFFASSKSRFTASSIYRSE
jgi:hypothetical protein